MSMPSFPERGTDITQDQALNMILASIAMEELALSHIINAEGEKLQYVLGTLPGKCGPCAGTKEVLEVNQSVTDLLEMVMHNQLLLKGKLEKVLNAKAHGAPSPEPPPECPPRCCKSSLQLSCAYRDYVWNRGSRLPWCCTGQSGAGISWYSTAPSAVWLDASRSYHIDFSLCLGGSRSGCMVLSLQTLQNNSCRELSAYPFAGGALPEGPVTLTGSAVVTPDQNQAAPFPILLALSSPESVCVKQASLCIMEL